ncbi:hypothetical protein HK096_009276 [Nowakowskiella sp. JEL0078]|nr:hypothetical protein HK096_009276 [Nowakowskiella sp. JEL0078]
MRNLNLALTVISSLTFALTKAYGVCQADVKIYQTGTVIPLVQVYNANGFQVSGNIVIGDGCTFNVTNFSMSNLADSGNVSWWGATNDSVVLGVSLGGPDNFLLVDNNAQNQNYNYQFFSDPYVGVNYTDVGQFRLFQNSTQLILAKATIPTIQPQPHQLLPQKDLLQKLLQQRLQLAQAQTQAQIQPEK